MTLYVLYCDYDVEGCTAPESVVVDSDVAYAWQRERPDERRVAAFDVDDACVCDGYLDE